MRRQRSGESRMKRTSGDVVSVARWVRVEGACWSPSYVWIHRLLEEQARLKVPLEVGAIRCRSAGRERQHC